MKSMKFRAAPNFLPAHTPSNLVSKQSGIVIRFIRIEPSFLNRFSGIISGSLNNISNLSLVSRLTSALASVQKADMGYKYSKIVTNENVVSLKPSYVLSSMYSEK